MIREAIESVRRGDALTREGMRELIHGTLAGPETSDDEIEELLRALHHRGETAEEIMGAAEALRELAVELPVAPADAVDTCGTGGDASGTFNISTTAALVVAGAGVPVTKHGNRAATSRCGSADVLEALGIWIEMPPERAAACVLEVGIGFLFARSCHPAMARVAPIRARLGFPTLFNRLGPLTNPMRVRRQLVGVADSTLCEQTLEILIGLGSESACVVSSEDGLDEASTCAASCFLSQRGNDRASCRLEPGRLLPRAVIDSLAGGDAERNAAITRDVLAGEKGPPRDVVLLNAAVAFWVAGRVDALAPGIRLAEEAIDSGSAADTLRRWAEVSDRERRRT